MQGARIGYFQGDIRLLTDDLTTLKPTVFPVVPRLLNRMYDKVGGHDDDSLINYYDFIAGEYSRCHLTSIYPA